jgi:hypothetical protein
MWCEALAVNGSPMGSTHNGFNSRSDLDAIHCGAIAGGRWLSSRDSYPRRARFDTGTCDRDGVFRSRPVVAFCYRPEP